MKFRILTAFSLVIIFSGCGSLPENPPQTVDAVDLERYSGRWFEIARLPVPFQKENELATAEYAINEEGTVDLVNTAITLDGKTRSVTGKAVPVEDTNNTRLKVTIDNFFAKLFGSPPDYGNYWILKLDSDYTIAVVGSPNRNTLWILARQPDISPEALEETIQHARLSGYPVEQLIINNGKFPTGY